MHEPIWDQSSFLVDLHMGGKYKEAPERGASISLDWLQGWDVPQQKMALAFPAWMHLECAACYCRLFPAINRQQIIGDQSVPKNRM